MNSKKNFYKKFIECIELYNQLKNNRLHRFFVNSCEGILEYDRFVAQIDECNKIMYSLIEIDEDYDYGKFELFTVFPEIINITINFKKDI